MSGTDQAGRVGLHYAASAGQVAVARDLITGGAEVSLPDRGGMTPLHFAAQEQGAEMVRLLLEAGAIVDAEDKHGNTPLWKAVFSSRRDGEVIGILRAAGADPNHANHHSTSPVGLARRMANYDVARFFADLPA